MITPTPETTPSFLQKQMLTGSLQNNCSKQQLKFPGRPASVLQKDFTMDVLPLNKLPKAKSNFCNVNGDAEMPMPRFSNGR